MSLASLLSAYSVTSNPSGRRSPCCTWSARAAAAGRRARSRATRVRVIGWRRGTTPSADAVAARRIRPLVADGPRLGPAPGGGVVAPEEAHRLFGIGDFEDPHRPSIAAAGAAV